MPDPRDEDPIEEPDDAAFAEIEAPPTDKRDVSEAEAMIYAQRAGLA